MSFPLILKLCKEKKQFFLYNNFGYARGDYIFPIVFIGLIKE